MTTETYNAIMAHADQFIAARYTTVGLQIVTYASHVGTIDALRKIARANNCTFNAIVVGEGDEDAEMHIRIRERKV